MPEPKLTKLELQIMETLWNGASSIREKEAERTLRKLAKQDLTKQELWKTSKR